MATLSPRLVLLTACIFMVADGEHLLGMRRVRNPDGTLYKELSWRAVSIVNQASNDAYHWIPIKVLRAFEQTVAGIKRRFELLIAKSNCTKNGVGHENVRSSICVKGIPSKMQICTFEVLERPWEDVQKITNKGCKYGDDMENDDKAEIEKKKSVKSLSTVKIGQRLFGPTQSIKNKDLATWNLFANFVDNNNRTYTTKKEMLRRFKIYKQNLRAAKLWQKNEQGNAEYGETPFSDMTQEEFRTLMLPFVWPPRSSSANVANLESFGVSDHKIPKSFDWREKGAVTEVKNQGACGSCWAFSVTGNIEGAWKIKTGKLVPLSEQELVDCDVLDKGCNGGLPMNAYKEIIRMGGLETEKDYPYDGRGETCHLRHKELVVYINDSVEIPKDERKMAAWLAEKGPISVGVNASPLQFYRHGIIHPWKVFCSPLHLDHGVLIVGYGEENDKPYWTIKNSWGTKWGEQGYFRLFRGKNVCGVDEMASSAIIY